MSDITLSATDLKKLQDFVDYWIMQSQPGPHPTKQAYEIWLALGFHSPVYNTIFRKKQHE